MALIYKMRAIAQSDNSYVFWTDSEPDLDGNNAPEAVVTDTITILSVGGTAAGGDPGPSRYAIQPETDLAWYMDETSDPFVSSGNSSLNLTKSGNVYHFKEISNVSDADAFLASSDTSTGETSGDLTVHGWINWNSHESYGMIFSKNYRTGTTWTPPYSSFMLQLGTSSNSGVLRIHTTTSGVYQDQTTSSTVPRYQWSHLALVFDSSTPEVIAYIDGVNSGGYTTAGSQILWGDHGQWKFGDRQAPSNEGVAALYSDWRVEHKALSPSEISDIITAGQAWLRV